MKKVKRLTLCRDTLLNLEKSLDKNDLRLVPGGITRQLCTEGTVACSLCRTC